MISRIPFHPTAVLLLLGFLCATELIGSDRQQAAEQAGLLLQDQRAYFTEKPAHFLNYTENGNVEFQGRKIAPDKGVALLASDGRFLIRTIGDSKKQSAFAWNGSRVFLTSGGSFTWYLEKEYFDTFAGEDTGGRLPYVDMYRGLRKQHSNDSKLVNYYGTGIRFSLLHLFDYMALEDMYFGRIAGKIGPVRWSDVCNEELYRQSLAHVTKILHDGKNRIVIMQSTEQSDRPRATWYLMQMLLEPVPGMQDKYRVAEITHRGPWTSLAEQIINPGSDDLTPLTEKDFKALAPHCGTHLLFDYGDESADIWIPSEITVTHYAQDADIPYNDVAFRGLDLKDMLFSDKSHVRRRVDWKLNSMEQLERGELGPLFDQFIMSQRQIKSITSQLNSPYKPEQAVPQD